MSITTKFSPRKELTEAFIAAQRWRAHHEGPLAGHGQASYLGDHILNQILPNWFRQEYNRRNWSSAFLTQGEAFFWDWDLVEQCGLTPHDWWLGVRNAHPEWKAYRCRVCGELWFEGEVFLDPTRRGTVWTCGNLPCGGDCKAV